MHLRTIAQLCRAMSLQLRHVSTILNSNISSTCPYFELWLNITAEIGWRFWGTAANFNGFRVLASLLHGRRSTEANQTLHDVRPSLGLLEYTYTFGGSCPLTEFCRCKVHFASIHAFCYIGSVTARHWTLAKVCGVQQRAPAIFGRAAITLDIGPHSSLNFICLLPAAMRAAQAAGI